MNKTHLLVSLSVALTAAALVLSHPKPPGAAQPDRSTADGAVRMRLHLSHAHPLEGGSVWAAVDVEAAQAQAPRAAPVQLVLVLDHSGSMLGDKMEKAKQAAQRLIDLAHDDDWLAVVAFDSGVDGTPLVQANAEGKAALRRFVDQVVAGSGTNISLGLETGAQKLRGVSATGARRIILVSDGQPTEGQTSPLALQEQVAQLRDGVAAVSALGVGVDFNGPLMTKLASEGGGFYGYLKDAGALAEVLSQELDQARRESASRLSLTLRPSGGVRVADVAGRAFTAHAESVEVPLPNLAPGQKETVYVRVDVPAGAGGTVGLTGELSFVAAGDGHRLVTEVNATPTREESFSKEGVDQALADQGLRVLGSQQVVQAAEAFERGDRASAFALLDNARGLFGMSADALAGDDKEVQQLKSRWQTTVDPDAVKHESLNIEMKKMQNFGMNNAY